MIEPQECLDVGDRQALRPIPLRVAGTTGFIGSVFILIGVAQSGSPFASKLPDAWFFGAGNGTSGASQNGTFVGIMVLYLGVALMIGSWFEVIRTLRRSPATPVGAVVAMIVAWAVPVLVMPPLFSRDVYSYAAQGEMVSRGINPYVHGPTALGHGPLLEAGRSHLAKRPCPVRAGLGATGRGDRSARSRHDVVADNRRISIGCADRGRVDRLGCSRSGPIGWA